MKQSDLFWLAVLGVGAFVAWKWFSKTVGAITAPVSSALANAWVSATSPSPMNVLGNVVFPDGSQTPLNQLDVRSDNQTGAVQVLSGGHIYQLQSHDSNGNWPAMLIQ
jgi:hypothetical protein